MPYTSVRELSTYNSPVARVRGIANILCDLFDNSGEKKGLLFPPDEVVRKTARELIELGEHIAADDHTWSLIPDLKCPELTNEEVREKLRDLSAYAKEGYNL